jgi:hypothetical protein
MLKPGAKRAATADQNNTCIIKEAARMLTPEDGRGKMTSNTGIYIFECGDRVHYVSGSHGVSENNPLKNSSEECAGTIILLNNGAGDCCIDVEWDNGITNSYSRNDIILMEAEIGPENPNMAFKQRKRKDTSTKNLPGFGSTIYGTVTGRLYSTEAGTVDSRLRRAPDNTDEEYEHTYKKWKVKG